MAKRGWSMPLEGYAKQIEDDVAFAVREITLQAYGMIIRLSPVDTGAFRGNNRVSIGTTDGEYELSATGRQNQQAARAVIEALRVPFTEVFIFNNLPYAEDLEHGSSRQAPAGVYGVTTDAIRARYAR